MPAVFQYFWIFLIIITCINAFVLKSKSKDYIRANPQLEKGYNDMFKATITIANIPWVIMGIGSLTGMTKSADEFFHPSQLNPIVLVFHLSTIIILLLGIRWIYFKKGAEFLELHPGLIGKRGFSGTTTDVSAKQVKLFFAVALIGAAIGMVMMWCNVIPFFMAAS
jgi:hypothetical protein